MTPSRPHPCPNPVLSSGLCGNFNGQEGDDFQTAGGLVEATAAGFANTWKAQSSCQDKEDWLDDPCALNIESGERLADTERVGGAGPALLGRAAGLWRPRWQPAKRQGRGAGPRPSARAGLVPGQ